MTRSLIILALFSLLFFTFDFGRNFESSVVQPKTASAEAELESAGDYFQPPGPSGRPQPLILSKAYLLIDGQSASPIISKNADLPVPVASTTKMMTAIVALENLELDRLITIPESSKKIEGSLAGFKAGELWSVENILIALLVQSSNDAAEALSHALGGRETMVSLMNRKAEKFGLLSSEFADAAGLDDSGRSTARDLSVLARVLLENRRLERVVALPDARIVEAQSGRTIDLKSSNRLLSEFQYRGALGIKTGFTYAAGHCLVAAARRGERTLIAVILNTDEQSPAASAKEARKLLDYGFSLSS